jgi:hypothetical protein
MKRGAALAPGARESRGLPWTQERVKAFLQSRYNTRLHMTAILATSGLVAMLANWLLLSNGVGAMLVRYPASILLAYLTFLTGIYVWLRLMGLRTNSGVVRSVVENADVPDVPIGGGGGGGGSGPGLSLPRGGGGGFDGGGASSSWSAAEGRMFSAAQLQQAPAGKASSGSGLKGALGDLGDAFDGDALVLLALAALLVLVVFATSGYLIFIGPDILSEAAFGALLAGGLAKPTRQQTAAGWIAGVVRKTWWPFALVLAAATALAWYAAVHYPEATTFREAFGLALS